MFLGTVNPDENSGSQMIANTGAKLLATYKLDKFFFNSLENFMCI